MEEMSVRLWRKKSLVTLTNAKVLFPFMTMSSLAQSLMTTCLQLTRLIFANGPAGLLVTSSVTHHESQTRREKRRPRGRTMNEEKILTEVCPSNLNRNGAAHLWKLFFGHFLPILSGNDHSRV